MPRYSQDTAPKTRIGRWKVIQQHTITPKHRRQQNPKIKTLHGINCMVVYLVWEFKKKTDLLNNRVLNSID